MVFSCRAHGIIQFGGSFSAAGWLPFRISRAAKFVRQCPRVFSIFDCQHAIYQHISDAGRVLVRFFKSRVVNYCLWIKNHHVREISLRQHRRAVRPSFSAGIQVIFFTAVASRSENFSSRAYRPSTRGKLP